MKFMLIMGSLFALFTSQAMAVTPNSKPDGLVIMTDSKDKKSAATVTTPLDSASAPACYTLPKGAVLSVALKKYAKRHGWDLIWSIKDDYMLDAPFPIPAGEVIEGIAYVVNAYQAQGGMPGVQARFATPNRIAVIEPMKVGKLEL